MRKVITPHIQALPFQRALHQLPIQLSHKISVVNRRAILFAWASNVHTILSFPIHAGRPDFDPLHNLQELAFP
jgi:hypothetical protein